MAHELGSNRIAINDDSKQSSALVPSLALQLGYESVADLDERRLPKFKNLMKLWPEAY